MKIRKVDDKPMVIHTKEKAKIHAHEPKGAKIKGSNIYTVERGPKTAGAKVTDTDRKKSYRKDLLLERKEILRSNGFINKLQPRFEAICERLQEIDNETQKKLWGEVVLKDSEDEDIDFSFRDTSENVFQEALKTYCDNNKSRREYEKSGKWLGQYETEDAAVEMIREMAQDIEGTTMKYEGYKIGPVIRDIRKDKGLLIEEVAAKTGISVSTLGQVEQGGRNLSMKNLYMLMEVYETDANSLLAIDCTPDSLDSRLKRLPADKQNYLKKTFDFMIEQALKSA